ncbi:tRNA (N6-threonylcarbamoyladenosine(37)-N6)-methyltransferase TrmO [candidate division KSB1 bacterium]
METMINITPIGVVRSSIIESADPHRIRQNEYSIEVYREFEEGLYRIEENEYLTITFHFHRSEGYKLRHTRYDGEFTGVFASRSPNRPGAIGISTVKLIERKGRVLRVQGLDALDGTPVLDIKPYSPAIDDTERERVVDERRMSNPRSEIIRLIRSGDHETLLNRAGALHGHFCPGLALGVLAGVHGMTYFKFKNDGMENLIAVVETNNCFSDGVQYASGCSFGNNGLIYRDLGKTAVIFSRRDGAAIRLSLRADFKAILDQEYPDFADLFQMVIAERAEDESLQYRYKKRAAEVSFALLSLPFDRLFNETSLTITVPDYAPVRESVTCTRCGENVMDSKAVSRGGQLFCRACAETPYPEFTGAGLRCPESE